MPIQFLWSRFSRITEIPTRLTSSLASEGDAAAFRDFAWLFVNIVSMALLELGKVPTAKLIRKYIRNIDPLYVEYSQHILDNFDPKWPEKIKPTQKKITDQYLKNSIYRDRLKDAVVLMEYFQAHDIDDQVLMGLSYAFRFERSYYDKITTAIAPFLDKLLSGAVGEIISPDYSNEDDNRPILNWARAIEQKACVYCGFDALSDAEISNSIGAAMFADLTSA